MNDVAVVVPTHDRPRLLRQTLRSILGQQDVALSVMVVDDGSPDAVVTRQVVEDLDDRRLVLLRNPVPLGVSAARNAGIAATSSTWVGFCDDDDLWAPDKLSRQIVALQAGDAAWVYAGDVSIDATGHIMGGQMPLAPQRLLQELERWNPVPAGSSNVLVRRDALGHVGLFDPQLRSGGDWDLFIRLAAHGPPAWVPAPLVAYRVHGATMTQNRRRMLADLEIIHDRYGRRTDRPRHLRWAAWDAFQAGERREALRHYAGAVAAGDLGSLARAAVLAAPANVVRRLHQRRSGARSDDDAYLAQARQWLGIVGAA